ncbi:phosphocarrier protein [Spinactinospora alkalitolerans]|uniref:Phosphocarrier protein HPr n=1 Tax=Spinactinospora alkalitolerans TaxID=687207 RepID=A0A852U0K2_9ACTN|nr:HPr family phosphocarrier protein [Spinactinospora alkalitolerans]NYE49631.1 phosphocarrier protein [Spinactinospora alkalitolerans]
MAERRVKVESEVGLHARPAALFVQAASKAGGEVTVAKGDGAAVSAKSILAVMGLGVRQGDEIVLTADGDGAEELLDRLTEIANES